MGLPDDAPGTFQAKPNREAQRDGVLDLGFHFSPDEAEQGREITQTIWADMLDYDGYVGHELLQDVDDPGHLFVVSRWTSREQADQVLRDYADNPNAVAANNLVSQPRRRTVAHRL
jgi:quinol monooxygenase YgiN